MRGFAILLAFQMIGFLLQNVAHVPLPSGVIGLALFTLSLFLKIVKLEWVEGAATFLNKHMLLFFAPVVVGAVTIVPYLKQYALPIVTGFFGSWLTVVLVSGFAVKALTSSRSRSKAKAPVTIDGGNGL